MNSTVQSRRAIRSILLVSEDNSRLQAMCKPAQGIGLVIAGCCTDRRRCAAQIRETNPDICIISFDQADQEWTDAIQVISRELRTPVIVVTGAQNTQSVERLANAGVLGILPPGHSQCELAAALTIAWACSCKICELTENVTTLSQRLEDRKTIERAKWILIQRLNMDEESAMRRLQKQARDHRRTLVDVSRSVLESVELLSVQVPCRSAG